MTTPEFEAAYLLDGQTNWAALSRLTDEEAAAVAERFRALGHAIEAIQVRADITRRRLQERSRELV